MKQILALILLLMNYVAILGQGVGVNIRGVVKDKNNIPMVGANVTLFGSENRIVLQLPTDSVGQFSFFVGATSIFTLEITYTGYKSFLSSPFKSQNKDFGLIELISANSSLKDVTVRRSNELVIIEQNAIIFNVAKSITAQGSNAFEALKKAPGVYIDNDRTIMLNGKSGIVILIDGKQTFLSGKELIDLLKSMPTSNIKSFEIMNTPSAKYDAAGAGGMINIKTNKSQIRGFNGTLTNGINYGITIKNVQDFSFNYRKKKYNFFANYNHFLGYRVYEYSSYRIQEGKLFDSYTNDTDKRMNGGLRLGADYEIDKKNTIGILLSASTIEGGGITQTKTGIGLGTTNIIDQILDAENDYYYQKTKRYNANINYKYEDSIGRIINLDIDYGTFDKGNANNQSNLYSQQNLFLKQNLYRSENNIDITLKGLRFDYTTNLLKGKLETGAKFSDVVSDNDAKFYHKLFLRDSVDDKRTSIFRYTERIAATYINYKKGLKKWNLQVGLRIENTISVGLLKYRSNGENREVYNKRKYTDLFPSFSVAVKANKKVNISLSYSRRIDRPSYPDLNPFVYLLDDVSYWQGNPDLTPQLTHRAILQYVYKTATVIGLTFAYTDQYSTRVNDGIPNSAIVIFRPLNLGVQKNVSLSLSQSKNIKKWWSVNFNGNIYQIHNIVAFDQFRNFNLKQTAMRMNLLQTFILPSKVIIELTGSYNSKRLIGANEIALSNSQVDIGIKKKIWKDKATLRAALTDVYKGNIFNSEQRYPGFYLKNYGYYESRQLRIGFTYRFADISVKGPRSRNSSLEAESSRAR